MHFIDSSFRRGTATILGTIMFVGIIMTAVIPMLLVMRQAETIHAMRKHELEIFDEERANEELYVYVYPVDKTEVDPPKLRIKVQNRGELSIKIIRLWVNDDPIQLNYPIQPMSEIEEIYTYPVSEEANSYYIIVTTDRGKSVAFDTPLNWEMGMGWESDILSVNVLVTSLPGNIFRIEVTEPDLTIQETLTLKYEPKFFIVDDDGTYLVRIFRGSKEIYYEEVIINKFEGPLVVWVFA